MVETSTEEKESKGKEDKRRTSVEYVEYGK